jgi:hypothetical protein
MSGSNSDTKRTEAEVNVILCVYPLNLVMWVCGASMAVSFLNVTK